MTDVSSFLNNPENSECKDLLSADTNSNNGCSGASTSGAGCGALSTVGASQTPGCNTTSKNLKDKVKQIMDCQSKLYQHTTQGMINTLENGSEDLFAILKDQGEIFATELEMAKSEIENEIKILEVVSMLNLGILFLILLFLLIIKTFR